jgi:hypothetical protein
MLAGPAGMAGQASPPKFTGDRVADLIHFVLDIVDCLATRSQSSRFLVG